MRAHSHRRKLFIASLSALAMLFVGGAAQAAPGAPPTCRLTFDAAAAVWQDAAAACTGVRLERDVNGIPTLYVSKTQQVEIDVVNINPLLYVASIGEVTLKDVDQLKDLAALFLQFGGLFGMAASGDKAPGPGPALPTIVAELRKSLRDVESRMTTFHEQEAAMLAAVQQMEFASHPEKVCMAVPTDTLEAWSTALAALRHDYDVVSSPDKDPLFTTPESKKARGDALDQAKAILDKERELMKTVAGGQVVKARAQRSADHQDCDGGGIQVGRRIVVAAVVRDEWSKVASFPLKIAKQSPYADAIVTSTPNEIATTFKLTSRQASLLGVGLGMTSSTIVSPSWSAATDPKNPAQKVVTRTGEEARAAVTTLMASYAFTEATASRTVRPLLEFGASVQSSKPGGFVGFGVAVAKYVRLGIGVTGQRVNALNGQTEDVTVVAGNDDIRTKSAWKGGWYWSFGLTLSGLPLFSRD